MVEETKSILSTEEDMNSSRMPLQKTLGSSAHKYNPSRGPSSASRQDLSQGLTGSRMESITTGANSGEAATPDDDETRRS